MTSKYSGLDLIQLTYDIDYLDYLALRRDAFIDSMRSTEKGREYLKKAWLLTQTEPDREGLRRVVAHDASGGE